MEREANRIVIFNVNWVGDVLFSTATIRNIRLNYPKSFIACIIPSRCYPVLKGNPHLDEIIIYDEKDRHKSFLDKAQFVQLLKSKRFDTAFLLHRSFTRALICRLAGIPQRVGYHTKKRAFLMNSKIIAPDRDAMHRIDYYLNVIEKAGLKVQDRYTEFFIDEEDGSAVREFLRKQSVGENDFVVVLNPGGNWLPKRWPKEYWAVLADKLISEYGASVVITGGSSDISLVTDIKSLMREKPVVACGVFNLKQLAALCKRSDLFVSADTGPLHIANAVGAKKIIAIFGPTSPAVTGPYPLVNTVILQKDVGCKVPCYITRCQDNRCMKAVTPADILKRVERKTK